MSYSFLISVVHSSKSFFNSLGGHSELIVLFEYMDAVTQEETPINLLSFLLLRLSNFVYTLSPSLPILLSTL